MPSKRKNFDELWETILENPEKAISEFNLVYVYQDQLPIVRKRLSKDFKYLINGRPLKLKDHLERIEKLVIPPAWQEVRISDLANGHLQAVGKDNKKRKQYKYHELWSKIRNQTKFYKMASFGASLPKIRKHVDEDLDQENWTKTKVLALVIRLMEETHIRIGSEQYARKNKTYGLSTLRDRHVKTYKNGLKFEFTGKRGKKHKITLRNKKLIRLVNQCEEIPGWELFQYFDVDGNKHAIESEQVNDYIQDISGESYTAKDFRTWAATIVFFESLKSCDYPEKEDAKQRKILKAYDDAARELGNTRNVCRKYYIHPAIPSSYNTGELLPYFKLADQDTQSQDYFTSSEKAVLKLVRNYRPDFTTKS
ncbi:DNA topoisomerase IB [Zeaxanthinibacter sp. PT1]|uniref:DNA topoisomerase IB n=1 Tax=Zeaxanthinibacter TaxID=561554 RepID=UPI00234BCA08|nr:DNA topoisomerase IB [Zeaxanthinibacter sp. PT1]MDC6350287.1 DNA topoisomerase IB [Zeaxanthinibacter sp. PT1]